MNFYINKIVLWLKNGKTRTLTFEKDKVNIITGNSKTGKTAILEIIDYCLCSSENNISKEHIGENVLWYGINFNINTKLYTIARGDTLQNHDKFYFSSTGGIPESPTESISMKDLKSVLEQEFSIDKNTIIPFGGKNIKQGSKISYRYFLMFNTISGDIIEHSKTYFDKQDDNIYREALPRIFDLVTGITTVKDLLLQDRLNNLNIELIKYNREKSAIISKIENRNNELKKITKKAIEAKLISESIDNFEKCKEQLKNVIETSNMGTALLSDYSDRLEELRLERQNLEIQKAKLKKFQNRYVKYKKNLEEQSDSLKPLEYIKKNFSKNIKNDEYLQFLNMLDKDYRAIRKTIRTKMPFESGVENKLIEITNSIDEIDRQISLIPNTDYMAIDDKKRLILLGEIKNDFLELINNTFSTEDIDNTIKNTENDIGSIESEIIDYEANKINVINALNDYIQPYIKKSALDDYEEYFAAFDYTKKMLKLREPKTIFNAKVSSSSDHMFLHLCLFLGLHEMLLDKGLPYIPSFLIIDQPTRPYFVNATNNFEYTNSVQALDKKDDWSKVLNIFTLLDVFMNNITANKHHFQMIVLEHVSKNAWQKTENIHLVDEFDGKTNALIPLIKEKDESQ